MAQDFGTGGATGSAIGEQLNDFFWSKVAVKEAKTQKMFSQMGNKLTQPKHYGDTIKKYHELPIIHAANINDQGIDGNGISLTAGKFYAYDADGVSTNSDVGYATLALAKAAAGATGSVKTGDGNFYGGSKDLSVQNGAFPALREIGGRVNAVGMKREVIEAKVEEFGHAIPFTKKSLDMDTEMGLKKRYSMGVGEAYGTLRESQIRNGLIGFAADNVVRAGGAISDITMDETSVITYTTFRNLDKALKDARVPRDTKLIDGSTKVGTTTVGAARYIYVGAELVPTLEDMTITVGGVQKQVWNDVAEYAAGGNIAEGEIGRIGGFRFIEVEEMPSYAGAGEDITDGVDADADGIEDTGAGFYETDGNFDVFPMLFVGSDSFATIGFEGDSARVATAMPTVDANSDWYGKNGVVSISWYFGLMNLRPERIRLIKTCAKVA